MAPVRLVMQHAGQQHNSCSTGYTQRQLAAERLGYAQEALSLERVRDRFFLAPVTALLLFCRALGASVHTHTRVSAALDAP
jgi:hypothetical protein